MRFRLFPTRCICRVTEMKPSRCTTRSSVSFSGQPKLECIPACTGPGRQRRRSVLYKQLASLWNGGGSCNFCPQRSNAPTHLWPFFFAKSWQCKPLSLSAAARWTDHTCDRFMMSLPSCLHLVQGHALVCHGWQGSAPFLMRCLSGSL